MIECLCEMVFQVENGFIPDYQNNRLTSIASSNWKPVPQYECLRCGKRWGYLGVGVKLIEAPKVIMIG